MRRPNSTEAGSALIWTILIITILSLVAAELLQVVSGKYHSTLHTAVWQESLLAAESGIDLGIIELRKSLYPAPNHAWEGWKTVAGPGSANYGLRTIPNAGYASTPMTIEVTVDAPPTLKEPGTSWQYYRIRTVGTMPIPGVARASDNKQDTRLRKLSMRFDRFTDGILTAHAVDTPRVSRRVEAIVRPIGSFDQAIMSVGSLDLTDHNIIVDSYDSRDPLKSTKGLYDVDKRQENGDIATDGAILNAGNARVFGDVATNSGTATGIGNITGTERDDFYQEPIPVDVPNREWWPAPTPITINNTRTLTARAPTSADASPARYVVNSISLSGNDTLTIAADPTAGTNPSYIEIYVTGQISTTGNGEITLKDGVKAKIYCAGDVSIAGNGAVNENNQPGDLLFYGITPADPSTTRSFSLGGNALLSAAVYAPSFDVQINNGGVHGSVFGSFVGKSVKMVGVTDLHYDEALSAGGIVNNYKIVSWFEDNR